ncbi:MAG: RIP metalloprotease RseP [Gammaproteobacteria bacterium]|nr:RIP metalloprotease RseP [Gammaproteobacteria bacterium]
MTDVIYSLLAFVFVIAVLVSAHEFGHFWVAKRLGVKVLRFSIGFGKPIKVWRGRDADATEYCIASLPLGGYVRMLDEREGPVEDRELHRAFNRQALWRRFAIVFAGPLSNFLLAILVYTLVFMIGVTGTKPVVGKLAAGGLAERGGFQTGDLIKRVDGSEAKTWDDAFLAIMAVSIDRADAEVEVQDSAHNARLRHLDFSRVEGDIDRENLMKFIGMQPYEVPVPSVIGQVEADGPAARAGLKAGDRITSVDDQALSEWSAWVEAVRKRPGETMTVGVERGGEKLTLNLVPESKIGKDGKTYGRIGAAVDFPTKAFEALQTTVRYWPLQALGEGLSKTGHMTWLTLGMLYSMIFGDVSVDNLSGPISIAAYAGESAGIGLTAFLDFIALISISLGVLNLLPIPVLDGGHLFFYLIEAVKGRPVSPEAELLGQRIGIAAILTLMVFAFYNDIARLLN